MDVAEKIPSAKVTSPSLSSFYGNLAGPAFSAGSMGTLGAMGTGASLVGLQRGAFSGVAAYGVSGNLPVIALTEMEYLEILRRRQQEALLLPKAREAAVMQSAKMQLAVNNAVGNFATDAYARQISRESEQ